jgi:iron-sulfur cluster assembly protein
MNDVVQQYSNNDTPAIRITEAAKNRILSYMATQGDCHVVRFSVKKTGCSGLSYVVDYVQEPLEQDIVLPLTQDVLICIDKKSYPYLKGLQVDYVKQGLNHKFVYENPNQTGQCGCGESFTVDKNRE